MTMKKFKIPKEDQFVKKFLVAIGILALLITIGSGMHQFTGNSEDIQESLIYTISLIAHINFEEVHNSYFYLLISLLGYVVQFYLLYLILEFVLEGKLQNIFSEAKIINKVKHMKGHYIICGGGRVGTKAADELKKYNKSYVIMEADKEEVEELKHRGYVAIKGDALEEKDLLKAGISNAGYLAACLGDDGDNILLVLTAKEHNPSLKISARAERERTVNKLRHAGAQHIIMPEALGGAQMAHALIKDETHHESQRKHTN